MSGHQTKPLGELIAEHEVFAIRHPDGRVSTGYPTAMNRVDCWAGFTARTAAEHARDGDAAPASARLVADPP